MYRVSFIYSRYQYTNIYTYMSSWVVSWMGAMAAHIWRWRKRSRIDIHYAMLISIYAYACVYVHSLKYIVYTNIYIYISIHSWAVSRVGAMEVRARRKRGRLSIYNMLLYVYMYVYLPAYSSKYIVYINICIYSLLSSLLSGRKGRSHLENERSLVC